MQAEFQTLAQLVSVLSERLCTLSIERNTVIGTYMLPAISLQARGSDLTVRIESGGFY